MLRTMNHYQNGPTVIRYPRGCGAGVPLPSTPEILPIGKAEVLQTGKDVTLVSLGTMIGIAGRRQRCWKRRATRSPSSTPASSSLWMTNASAGMRPPAGWSAPLKTIPSAAASTPPCLNPWKPEASPRRGSHRMAGPVHRTRFGTHPQKKIWTHGGSRATKNHSPPEFLTHP